jgi:hypothetical protein
MVTGLDKFIDHFALHQDKYVLIGGAACDWLFEQQGLAFRATKDLDVVLVVEAIDDAFVRRFWEFVKLAGYQRVEQGQQQTFYRFQKPDALGYPKMVELFSRLPEGIRVPEGFHLTPIPTGEDVSSLSAILLDEDYYGLLLSNSPIIDGLKSANDIALIALKAKAWLNNLALQEAGLPIQSGDVKKHLNDVLRIATVLRPDQRPSVASTIQTDLRQFVAAVRIQNPDIRPILRPLGAEAISLAALLEVIEDVFQL